jgi:hypothetical protein
MVHHCVLPHAVNEKLHFSIPNYCSWTLNSFSHSKNFCNLNNIELSKLPNKKVIKGKRTSGSIHFIFKNYFANLIH